jgi:hypothetical protein
MKILEHRFGYGLSVFVLIISVLAMWQATSFQSVSAWFPLFVSGAAAAVAAIVIAADVVVDRRSRRVDVGAAAMPAGATGAPTDSAIDADPDATEAPRSILLGFTMYILWFIGFALLLVLFGMPLAVFLWTLGFIRFASRESWARAVISAVAITGALIVLAGILALAFPEGLILDSNLVIPNWRL